jgi:hypothetical protein
MIRSGTLAIPNLESLTIAKSSNEHSLDDGVSPCRVRPLAGPWARFVYGTQTSLTLNE